MKIFVDYLDKDKIEKLLEPVKHIDFSIFIQCFPKSADELSSINILSMHEPSKYFNTNPWVIQNKDVFHAILTWDDEILNKCENAVFLPFGSSWFKPDQYEKDHAKKFELSHLSGALLKTHGHHMRHEILDRENEFKLPTNFRKTIGDRYNLEDARIGKETMFANSLFGVAIENFSHRGYFTEKILDCFLLKTVPLYWGCSNIGDFFDMDGIIKFENVDDLIYKSNELHSFSYPDKKDAIENNYQKALQYIDYEQNVVNKVLEIFKLNQII